MYRFLTLIIFSLIFFCHPVSSFSEDITILYTGETHASLYPCHCPINPDGGLARRATKIKQIRKENPNILLVDSGGFFAGGVLDQHSQNTELDKLRTQITLKAYDLMGYGALAVGDDEFNFGKEFLIDEISKSKIPLISSNIESEDFIPFIIKEIAGIKLGIFALVGEEAKAKSGLNILDFKEMASKTVAKLRQEGANVIILLSHLGEDVDLQLAQELEGIDILVTGHRIIKRDEPLTKIDSTLLIRPAWEGRRLGRLNLKIEDKKIVDYKAEEIRLSSDIADDPDIKKILPECFSDKDCRKPNSIGKCVNPSAIDAHCEFSLPTAIDLTIIRPKINRFPYNPENVINGIRRYLPGVKVNYLDYPGRKAEKFIKELNLKMLPAYILPADIEKEDSFNRIQEILDKKDNYYLLKPYISGVTTFVGRKRINNRMDVFLTLKEKDVAKLLDVLRQINQKYNGKINISLHLIAFSDKDGFKVFGEDGLVEEYLRVVSVMHNYPSKWWDYVICRTKDIKSSWWDDCLKDNNMDLELIKQDVRSTKASGLLKENIKLTEELEISNSPAFLFENQEIFSTQDIPTVEELEGVIFGG